MTRSGSHEAPKCSIAFMNFSRRNRDSWIMIIREMMSAANFPDYHEMLKHGLVICARCVAVLGMAASTVLLTETQGIADKLDLSTIWVGSPPQDFDFRQTGDGSLGTWTVIKDPTAVERIAIEHISTDQTEDRFALAIYKPLSVENIEARL